MADLLENCVKIAKSNINKDHIQDILQALSADCDILLDKVKKKEFSLLTRGKIEKFATKIKDRANIPDYNKLSDYINKATKHETAIKSMVGFSNNDIAFVKSVQPVISELCQNKN